jgi:homogentisate 1,2-dioxygenase
MAEQIYQRIDLAKEQLGVALELFLSRRSMVSAITLAGVAEEILGKALKLASEENNLTWEYKVTAPVEEQLRRKPYEWKEFTNQRNRARNAAKHMDEELESCLAVDLEDEAIRMLVRACDNYNRLGFPTTPEMSAFDEWFWINVVGIDHGG